VTPLKLTTPPEGTMRVSMLSAKKLLVVVVTKAAGLAAVIFETKPAPSFVPTHMSY